MVIVTECFLCHDPGDLERKINDFCNKKQIGRTKLVDIKFLVETNRNETTGSADSWYTAFIIYDNFDI